MLPVRDKMAGIQCLFSVLVGIYAHFTGTVLGRSALACLFDFNPPDGGSKN